MNKILKDEIIPLIDTRINVIENDPDNSSYPFESIEFLRELKEKIERGDDNFDDTDLYWLIEYVNERLDWAYYQLRAGEDALPLIKSLKSVLKKLESLRNDS